MQRPMWSGMISFGLVNIPVRLFNVVKNNPVRFHQLRKSDGCRINHKKICPGDGQEVADDNIIRGFEISPGRYITVATEELAAVAAKASHSIEIEDFVRLEQINPIYYDRSFYVVPDKGAGKSYALLLKAMKNKERVGVARFVLRNKEYLAALRPMREVLGLSTLVFPEEIVSPELFTVETPAGAEPDKRELAMAKALIESLAGDFEPAKYHDEYRRQVMDLIERKSRGQTVTPEPVTSEKAKVINIMEALEASLAAAKKKPSGESGRRKRKVSR